MKKDAEEKSIGVDETPAVEVCVTENAAAADGDASPVKHTAPAAADIDSIIRHRVYAALGVGLVPLPLVDLAGLTAVQVELLTALCKAHGVPFKTQWLKSSISSLCGSALTVAAVPVLSSLFKSIPVIGTTVGAATISLSGAASTYALGWVFDRHFRSGGTLGNFKAEKFKEYYKEKKEEGKAFASKLMRKKANKTEDAAAAPEAGAAAAKETITPESVPAV